MVVREEGHTCHGAQKRTPWNWFSLHLYMNPIAGLPLPLPAEPLLQVKIIF